MAVGTTVKVRRPATARDRVTCAAHPSPLRTLAHYVGELVVGGAYGMAVATTVRALWPEERSSGSSPSPNPDLGEVNDDERLTTRIDGEEARLLVHIERTDPEAAGSSAPVGPSGPSQPDSATLP